MSPEARADNGPPAPALSPIDQLTGPIALYPDPLVALILPASTVPSDVKAASEYIGENGDPSQIDNQPWDPSVRGLAHYPNVVTWMAQNPEWTQALGEAFTNDPSGVMASIQHLRAIAKTSGTLSNTPQQDIVEADGNISIEPADPETMYVPSYDPAIVYAGPGFYGYNGPYMTFGIGFGVGYWLGYGLDWNRREIWIGDWKNWHNEHGWNRPLFPGHPGYLGTGGTRNWAPNHAAHYGYSPMRNAPLLRVRQLPGPPPPPEPRRSTAPRWNPSQRVPAPATSAPRVGQWSQSGGSLQHQGPAVRNGGAQAGMMVHQPAPSSWQHSSAQPVPHAQRAPAAHGGTAQPVRETQQRSGDSKKDPQR
jgi:hypothetical protein